MPQTLNPKLNFITPESLAAGVTVHPVQLPKQTPFEATYFQVLPGCQTPIDCHQEQEVWLVLQGKGVLIYQGESTDFSVHDIFYFTQYMTHQVINTGDKTLIICSIFW